MVARLLAGRRVVDLTREPAAMARRARFLELGLAADEGRALGQAGALD